MTPVSAVFSYWGFYPAKMMKIKKEYKSFYPSGKIDLLRRLFQYAAFVWAGLALVPLGFFR